MFPFIACSIESQLTLEGSLTMTRFIPPSGPAWTQWIISPLQPSPAEKPDWPGFGAGQSTLMKPSGRVSSICLISLIESLTSSILTHVRAWTSPEVSSGGLGGISSYGGHGDWILASHLCPLDLPTKPM